MNAVLDFVPDQQTLPGLPPTKVRALTEPAAMPISLPALSPGQMSFAADQPPLAEIAERPQQLALLGEPHIWEITEGTPKPRAKRRSKTRQPPPGQASLF